MTFNEAFPRIVCINLDRRPDRWRRMQKRLRALQITGVERFPAVDGDTLPIPQGSSITPAALGCLRSHLAVVRRAQEEGWPHVFILEDDVEFAPDFQERFAERIAQLPKHWDMLYLGANHLGDLQPVTAHLARPTRSNSTFAYALHRRAYQAYLDANTSADQPIDLNLRSLHASHACFCMMPHLAWVEVGDSDITGTPANFWWIRKSLVMDGTQVRSMLSRTVIIVPQALRSARCSPCCGLPSALRPLLRFSPELTVLLIQTGGEPRHPLPPLPANCHRLFLKPPESGTRAAACDAGFREFRATKDFFVFHDEDILLHPHEFSANLQMARKFDFVQSFTILYALTPMNSALMLRQGRWTTDGARETRYSGLGRQSCLLTREALDRVESWPEGPDSAADAQLARRVRENLKIFISPGRAFRIDPGFDPRDSNGSGSLT